MLGKLTFPFTSPQHTNKSLLYHNEDCLYYWSVTGLLHGMIFKATN